MTTPEVPGPGPHVDVDLLAALSMELGIEQDGSGDVDESARAHVAACTACTAEVAALRETLSLVVAARDESFTAPPASVWEAVSATLDADDGTSDERPQADGPATAPAAAPTVAPADLPARRSEVASLDARRRRVPTWWVAAAAAVALLAGVGIGTQVVGDGDRDAPAPTVVAATQLASLDDVPQARGAAEVRRLDDRVSLHVEAAGLDGPDGTREVWLINVDGTRMVSLGLLPGGETGEFDFPERLLEQGYRIVDVSYEPDDGDPAHSGTSLARGTIEG